MTSRFYPSCPVAIAPADPTADPTAPTNASQNSQLLTILILSSGLILIALILIGLIALGNALGNPLY